MAKKGVKGVLQHSDKFAITIKHQFTENQMSDENSIPEVLKSTSRSSLGTAKMFLNQSVGALLEENNFGGAKQVIEILQQLDQVLNSKHVAFPRSHSDSRFSDAEVEAIRAGRKIDAIKMVRERTAMGLKEAKDLVESYQNTKY
jgi:hypothetical protein